MGLKAKTTEKRQLTVITGFSGAHGPMVVLHAMPGIAVDEPFTCDMKRASAVFRAHMGMPMPKHMHEDMASVLSALRCQGRCNCFLHGKACPVPKIKPMQTDILILSSSCHELSSMNSARSVTDCVSWPRGSNNNADSFFMLCDIIAILQPKTFITEQTAGAGLHYDDDDDSAWNTMVDLLKKSLEEKQLPYTLSSRLLQSEDHGLPQSRKRYYLAAPPDFIYICI